MKQEAPSELRSVGVVHCKTELASIAATSVIAAKYNSKGSY